jgi:polysaccharide export outer membrane protein
MLRPLGHCPALICAAVLFVAQTCAGQTTPPPAGAPVTVTPPAPPSGPVVVGDMRAGTETQEPAEAVNPAVKPARKSAGTPSTHDASAAYATPSKPYVIGALDVLEVGVYGSPNLSGFKDVGSDGMITMPLIGEIRADGLTKEQLTDVIRDKLAATVFVDPPEVTVQVARVNSKKYYVFGGVNHPGEFPIMGTMTVLDAFANTGGFHDFAKTNKIYILRNGKPIPFNYKEVSHGKKMEQNIQIENGDRIFVPEN